ncbi:hypothetical protein RvY_05638 [Ramazzottius varieornatus]|uniref:Uncharacterized protein n=1 Tax=Ramazzottius varieornatus TaxID=947166 RepID=A0A1D1V2D9_RAMVA|nr:hypothetical protein RvY_05638 [Ramazzottius varieornatus]
MEDEENLGNGWNRQGGSQLRLQKVLSYLKPGEADHSAQDEQWEDPENLKDGGHKEGNPTPYDYSHGFLVP